MTCIQDYVHKIITGLFWKSLCICIFPLTNSNYFLNTFEWLRSFSGGFKNTWTVQIRHFIGASGHDVRSFLDRSGWNFQGFTVQVPHMSILGGRQYHCLFIKSVAFKATYRINSNNSPPLIIVAPPEFLKKVSNTSNNRRPLIIVAFHSDLDMMKLLYFLTFGKWKDCGNCVLSLLFPKSAFFD